MLRSGVLASHEGTTLQCILDGCKSGRINGWVAVVISNNGRSGALRTAASGSASLHLSSFSHGDAESLDEAIRDALLHANVQVVFLGGYMKRLGPRTLAAFRGRILNTHPALLPKFGGQGMFGDRVFEVAEGNAWVAVVENTPVSLSAFNAALPDIVQLGGIYTPPALRGRGFAKVVVAASLLVARDRGSSRAVLFTKNPSAARTYEAIGFRRIGDYSLVLLR